MQRADPNPEITRQIRDFVKTRDAEATAVLLVAIDIEFYLTFSMDNPKSYSAMSEYANLTLFQAIEDDIKNNKNKDTIQFWIDVMNGLIAKKDFLAPAMIRLKLDQMQKTVKGDIHPLFDLLDQKHQASLEAFQVGSNMKMLSNYYIDPTSQDNDNATPPFNEPLVPFFEIFALVKEMAKEAGRTGDRENIGVIKTRDFDNQTKARAWQSKSEEANQLQNFKEWLAKYMDNHRSENKVDHMKLSIAQNIMIILNSPELNDKQKYESLSEMLSYAKEIPHENIMHKVIGSQTTLAKKLIEFMPHLQTRAIVADVTSEISRNNIDRLVSHFNETAMSYEAKFKELSENITRLQNELSSNLTPAIKTVKEKEVKKLEKDLEDLSTLQADLKNQYKGLQDIGARYSTSISIGDAAKNIYTKAVATSVSKHFEPDIQVLKFKFQKIDHASSTESRHKGIDLGSHRTQREIYIGQHRRHQSEPEATVGPSKKSIYTMETTPVTPTPTTSTKSASIKPLPQPVTENIAVGPSKKQEENREERQLKNHSTLFSPTAVGSKRKNPEGGFEDTGPKQDKKPESNVVQDRIKKFEQIILSQSPTHTTKKPR